MISISRTGIAAAHQHRMISRPMRQLMTLEMIDIVKMNNNSQQNDGLICGSITVLIVIVFIVLITSCMLEDHNHSVTMVTSYQLL